MKRLRLYGLLVTVLVLAFGLALGCDNGTTETDDTDAVTTTFFDAANNITITFSNKAIEARARAAGPNDGDYYQIKRGSALLSSGTIQLQGNGTTIKFIEDSGATFTGQFLNNLLTINDTVGGQALTVAASTPGTSGGGGPSGTGDGGGGTSPSGGGGAASGAVKAGKAIDVANWSLTFPVITDQGFTITAASALYNSGNQPIEYAAGLSTGSSPTTTWQKALDFNGLDAGKEYTVWARTGAITAAESADDNAYTTGPVSKGTALVTTKPKGEKGADISSFIVVANNTLLTHNTIGITNSAVVTNNPGGQLIEYAVSKTTAIPTSGWLPWNTDPGSPTPNANASGGFTGLDPVTKYYVFARTKYTPAVGNTPAYSAGTAFRGDEQIETKKSPGGALTYTSEAAVTIAPGSATGTKEAGGELYLRKVPTVSTTQTVEYTFSKNDTGNPATSLAVADTFKWWTPSLAAAQEPTSGTAGLVGISKSVTVTAETSGAIKFAGILGSTTSAAETYGIYARSKSDTAYEAGTAVLVGTAVKVLIKPPALLDIEATAGSESTAGFEVTIDPDGTSGDALTDTYIASLPFEFNLATGTNSTTPVLPSWAAYTPATPVAFTGLESGTTYALLVRVKEDTNFAEGPIYVADGDLETEDGDDIDDEFAIWEPTDVAAATKKGLQFVVTGGGAAEEEDGTPIGSPSASFEYGITEQATGDTPTLPFIKIQSGLTFTGLKQKTTYTLWVRFAADATGSTNTGPWVKATGTYATVTTGEGAVYKPADLANLTIPTRTATGFTVSNIITVALAAPHDTQSWQVTTTPAPAGAIPANPQQPAANATWVPHTSGSASITGLEPSKAYLVWIRSTAVAGEYEAGTPQVLPIRGVTLLKGVEVSDEWLDANVTASITAGTIADDDFVVTIAFEKATLSALENGQTVEFWVGTAEPTSAAAWKTVTATGANVDLKALITAAGDYTVYVRAKANDAYDAGPPKPISAEVEITAS